MLGKRPAMYGGGGGGDGVCGDEVTGGGGGPGPNEDEMSDDGSQLGGEKKRRLNVEQVRTLDKKRLRERMGHVEEQVMEKVDTAIAVSFGLPHDQFV